MARRRLGVTLLIPPPAAVEIDGLRRALGDGARTRIPPHVTLVPPVNVPGESLADALAVLRDAADHTSPLDLRIGPAATFHPVNPVVYLQISGAADALAKLRERVLMPPLERAITLPFVPHVTVADDMDPSRIPAAVEALADYVIDVRIDTVHLLEEGRGRVWHPIADVTLTRRWVPG
jgi:2'-5' RNA ligase